MPNKYTLFLSYPNNFMHCHVFDSLPIIADELERIAEDEELNEITPTLQELQKHFEKEDFYLDSCSNGLWYHIQEQNDWSDLIESTTDS